MTPSKEIASVTLCEKTLSLKNDIEKGFLVLGKNLHKIREEELYKCQWLKWEDYLDDMKMSSSTASKLITIYEKFILEWKIDEKTILNMGGYSNAYTLIPMLKGKEDDEVKEKIREFSLLSRSDLEQKKNEEITGVNRDTCKHKDTYLLKICRDCGYKEKINED
jgi:hypothetical protein